MENVCCLNIGNYLSISFLISSWFMPSFALFLITEKNYTYYTNTRQKSIYLKEMSINYKCYSQKKSMKIEPK